jgi:hypothetical protein
MFRIGIYQYVQNTLLLPWIGELVTTHGNCHTSCVHRRRSTAIGNCHATEAFYNEANLCLEYASAVASCRSKSLSQEGKLGEREASDRLTSIRLVAARWEGPRRGVRGSYTVRRILERSKC